jgi:PPOX class probable F420-dependent enzyme
MESKKQPTVGRSIMPDGYGVPENDDTVLPWSYVEERMASAKNYWIATASPEGKPSATPVWGAWVEGRLYFDGSPETRRGKNIAANPKVTVHLESGDEVVILEGEARIFSTAPERALSEKVAAAYREKYEKHGYAPQPNQWDQGGLFEFTPRSVMGWSKFPENVTRWKLS